MSSGKDSSEEELARYVVADITGATVERADHSHAPPGTVDGWMTFDGGRTGALEISTLGTEDEFELEGRLRSRGRHLPAPGDWKWVISLRDHRELARIETIYSKVIVLCERYRVQFPDRLPMEEIDADEDLTWLWAESTTDFFGVMIPEGAKDRSGTIDLSTGVTVTAWDGDELVLPAVVASALSSGPLAKRVEKLLRTTADERHLFLRVVESGLPEPDYYNLIQHSVWPADAKPVDGDPGAPDGITHIWLMTGWGRKVTRWTRGVGWDHPSYSPRPTEPTG